MKSRKRKLRGVLFNKKRHQQKYRFPVAPPSVRHSAKKGTGYNRNQEKKEFRDSLKGEL